MAVADETRAHHRVIGAVMAIVASAALVGCGSAPGPVSVTPAPMAPGATEGPAGEEDAGPAEDAAWWRIHVDARGITVGQIFDMGTLGDAAPVATVDVPMQLVDPNALVMPMRPIIGPRDGLIATIGGDAREGILTSIDAGTGDRRVLVRTQEIIVDAVFATGPSVVFLTADPRDGSFTGGWRVDAVAPHAQPEPVEGLVAAADFQLAARSVGHSRLFASPSGDVVALLQCTAAGACVVRAVNLVDGTRYEQPLAATDEPIGIAGERLFLRPVCQAECAGELLDLSSGERAPIPGTGNPMGFEETVIDTRGGAMVVTQVSGQTVPMEGAASEPAFVLTSLDDGRTGEPIPVDLAWMRVVVADSHELGIELAPGWFAVMGAQRVGLREALGLAMGVFAVSAADGRVVPLPALGEFWFQG